MLNGRRHGERRNPGRTDYRTSCGYRAKAKDASSGKGPLSLSVNELVKSRSRWVRGDPIEKNDEEL